MLPPPRQYAISIGSMLTALAVCYLHRRYASSTESRLHSGRYDASADGTRPLPAVFYVDRIYDAASGSARYTSRQSEPPKRYDTSGEGVLLLPAGLYFSPTYDASPGSA